MKKLPTHEKIVLAASLISVLATRLSNQIHEFTILNGNGDHSVDIDAMDEVLGYVSTDLLTALDMLAEYLYCIDSWSQQDTELFNPILEALYRE